MEAVNQFQISAEIVCFPFAQIPLAKLRIRLLLPRSALGTVLGLQILGGNQSMRFKGFKGHINPCRVILGLDVRGSSFSHTVVILNIPIYE